MATRPCTPRELGEERTIRFRPMKELRERLSVAHGVEPRIVVAERRNGGGNARGDGRRAGDDRLGEYVRPSLHHAREH